MLETTRYEPISVFLTEYSTDAQTLRTFTTTPFNTSDNGIPRSSNVTCPEARLVISRSGALSSGNSVFDGSDQRNKPCRFSKPSHTSKIIVITVTLVQYLLWSTSSFNLCLATLSFQVGWLFGTPLCAYICCCCRCFLHINRSGPYHTQ